MTSETASGRIFALSVAINRYERLAPLSGCINDVDAFADWLRGRIPKDALSHKRLVDAEATRAAVSDAFRALQTELKQTVLHRLGVWLTKIGAHSHHAPRENDVSGSQAVW